MPNYQRLQRIKIIENKFGVYAQMCYICLINLKQKTIMKTYIKNLEFNFFSNFGKQYLTVQYNRNGEFHKITFSNIPSWVCDEKSVRKFINN